MGDCCRLFFLRSLLPCSVHHAHSRRSWPSHAPCGVLLSQYTICCSLMQLWRGILLALRRQSPILSYWMRELNPEYCLFYSTSAQSYKLERATENLHALSGVRLASFRYLSLCADSMPRINSRGEKSCSLSQDKTSHTLDLRNWENREYKRLVVSYFLHQMSANARLLHI